MDCLEKVYADYNEGVLDLNAASRRIIEIIFENKKEMGLSKLDEDSFSDFLLFQMTHIQKIFDAYIPESGSFTNFVFGSLQISLVYWKRKQAEERNETKLLDLISNDYISEKEQKYASDEKSEQINQMSEITAEDLQKADINIALITRFFRNAMDFKIALHVLTLKSCYFVTDELIAKVSTITGTSIETLTEWIELAKKSLKLKADRIERIKARRDNAYFFRNKYLLQKEKFSDLESWVCAVNRKYALQQKRWTSTLAILYKAQNSLSPSNVAIANILGIDERKVAYILKKIAANIDSFSTQWYSLKHENLPCKQ